MAYTTRIEWCDSTFNPWIGCTQVSPACDHCYAAVSTPARAMKVEWGAGMPRHRTSLSTWRQPIAWERQHEQFFAKHGRSRRVFCASLADVFDNEVDAQWRADLFRLIQQCPNLDWLLLTKRIGNAHRMLDEVMDVMSHGLQRWDEPMPWPNVWIGATVCNQTEVDRDIPKLLATPAQLHFLSCEPLLGPIDLGINLCGIRLSDGSRWQGSLPLIDWVIAGGESGGKARPWSIEWARSLRDQCAAGGVPFHWKQNGEWAPVTEIGFGGHEKRPTRTFDTGRTIETQGGPVPLGVQMIRVGKKAAGRTLDGVIHDAFPE